MAELNWIDKNERLPTKEDANKHGSVYAVIDGEVKLFHYGNATGTFSGTQMTHWLPFASMPVPKRWRTPTIHDLAKAGKPIPCRWKMNQSDAWTDSDLFAVSVGNGPLSFFTFDGWKQFCEICDG